METVVAVVASAVVGTAVSAAVTKITGSKTLGAILGMAAGFGMNAIMPGGIGGDVASTGSGGSAASAADAAIVNGGGSLSGLASTAQASTLANGPGSVLGSSMGQVDSILAGSAGKLASSAVASPVLGAAASNAAAPGLLDKLTGLLPSDPLTKYGMMQMGGNLLSGFTQGAAKQEEIDLLKQKQADERARGPYGIATDGTQSNLDIPSLLAKIQAPTLNGAPVRPITNNGAPVVASANPTSPSTGLLAPQQIQTPTIDPIQRLA